MQLPAPDSYSPRVTRWSAEKVIQAEQDQGIQLPAPNRPTLSADDLADRYGVTRVTIWRWSRKANTKKDDRRTGRGRAAA